MHAIKNYLLLELLGLENKVVVSSHPSTSCEFDLRPRPQVQGQGGKTVSITRSAWSVHQKVSI